MSNPDMSYHKTDSPWFQDLRGESHTHVCSWRPSGVFVGTVNSRILMVVNNLTIIQDHFLTKLMVWL